MKFLIHLRSQSQLEKFPHPDVFKEEWLINPTSDPSNKNLSPTTTQWFLNIDTVEDLVKLSSTFECPIFLISYLQIDPDYLNSFILPADYQLDGAIGIYDEEIENSSSSSEK